MALTERLALLVSAEGAGAISEFKRIGKAAQDAHNQVAKAQKDTTASTGRLDSALKSLGISGSTALKAGLVAGAAAAGLAIEKFVSSSISEFARYGAQVRRLQRITGASAEDSSRLAVAFRTVGVDAIRGGTAVFRFLNNVDKSADTLRGFGVEIVRSRSGIVETIPTLRNLADAYSRTQDPSRKAALLAAAFGQRIGTELIPLLSRGAAGFDEIIRNADRFGLTLSSKDLQSTLQYTMATRHFGEAIEGLKVSTGRSFIGGATGLANFGTTLAVGFGKMFHDLGRVVSYVPGVQELGNAFAGVANQASAAGAALEGPLAALSKGLQQALSSQAGQLGLLNSERAASLQVAVAKHGLAVAQQQLNEAQRGGNRAGEDAVAIARRQRDAQNQLAVANRDVAKAEQGIADAESRVAAAQERLDKARQGPNPRDLIRANFDVREAVLGVQDAEQALADLYNDASPSALDLAHAQLSLEEATQRLADAQLEAGQIAEQNGKEQSDAQKELEDAQRGLQEAQDRLVDSQNRVRDAQDGVTESMRRAASAAPDVVGAALAVQQAHLQLDAATAAAGDSQTMLDTALAEMNADNAATVLAQMQPLLDALRLNGENPDDLPLIRALKQLAATRPGSGNMGVLPNGVPVSLASPEMLRQFGQAPPPAPAQKKTPLQQILGVFRFQEGGIVPGHVGQPQMAIVHGGESVLPAGASLMVSGGGGTINVTVNAAPGQDAREIALIVRDELLKLKRRNVSASLS